MALEEATVKEEIVRLAAEIRDERMAAIDPVALRWLALLPEWTVSLAVACDFPTGDRPLEDLLESALAARLCEVHRQTDIDGTIALRFWMPDSTRSSLLEQWQREDGPRMRSEAAEIAARVLAAIEHGTRVSRGVSCWARLADRELAPNATPGEALTRSVSAAMTEGDSATALEWAFAGQELAKPLGAEMELAVTRALRRINLHYRALQDARRLSRFVERPEQMAAVDDLLASEDEWAAHFIGPSGVGKTMLLRYLAGSQRQVARVASASLIDFDYIDPRYPLERPARLLEELAHGLEDDIEDDAQESLLRSFRDAVADVDALGAHPDPLGTEEFERVVVAFAAFVTELRPPVLLILDTCEELAKLHPAGEDVPSIGAAFEIVERVHAAAPAVRVAFAGRRWLTPIASNMERRGAVPGSVMSLQKRRYLRMHEVRGFDRAEAVRYLREGHGLDLDSATIDAVLDRAPESGRAPSVGELDAAPRYSPADLEIFGDWLERDPGLSVETIEPGDFSRYVQARIVDRLADSPEVLAAIPAAVQLERFDSRAIQPALGGDTRTRSLALAGLIEQEWTHLRGGPEPDDIVLEIDPGLLPRLRSYYEDDPRRRAQLDAARAVLAPHLAKLLDSPPEELSADLVDAALRVLDPPNAATGFDRLAERVVRGGTWSWAEAVCGRLLSEERETRLAEPVKASVRALYVAALAQRGTSVDLGPLWESVEAEAPWHPDLEQWAILTARGRLGAVRAQAARGEVDENAVAAAYEITRPLLGRPRSAPVLVPALVATVEALVDLAEEHRVTTPPTLVQSCIEWLDDRFESEATRAYVLTLAGRLHAIRGDWDAAREVFDRVSTMGIDSEDDAEPRSADWVAPASRSHRTLLELLRFELADRSETDELLTRCEAAALADPGSVDAAQLLSLTLQARLASGSLTATAIDRVAEREQAFAGHRLAAPAHRVAPPLFVSIADGSMALGRAHEARRLLAGRERLESALHSDETRAAVLGSVRAVRRLRLRDRLGLVVALSSSDDDELRTEALAAGALIVGMQPALGRATDYDHAAWRARILLDARGDEDALTPPRAPKEGSADSPVTTMHGALDRLEAEMIRWRAGTRRVDPAAHDEVRGLAASLNEAGTIQDPLDAEQLRVALRLHAFLDSPLSIPARRRQLAARLALDEGELLALRLPQQAAKLLWLAKDLFEPAGDAQGAFMAGLRAAIAEIHAGRADRARSRRHAILSSYERVRGGDPALPPFEALTAPGVPDQQADEALRSSPLRSWLRRLVTYLRWCDDVALGSESWTSTLGVDPELALVPAARSTTLATPSRRARLRRFGGLGLATLTPLATAFVTGAVLGASLAIGLAVAGAVILLTLAAELIAIVLPRLVLPVDQFDVSVAPARTLRPGHTTEAELWGAPQTRHKPVEAYLHLLRLFRPRRWAAIMPLHEGAGQTPPRPMARAVRPRFRRGYLPVRLIVTPDLAPFGWERRLASRAVLRHDASPVRWPRIWRVRPEGLFSQAPEAFPEAIGATCAPSWRPFVERASEGVVDALNPPTAALKPTSQPVRAVIALGAPVITRAGWRLHLDDERPDAPSSTQRQRVLESPDRLVREAPIVVVFGRPGGQRPTIDRRMTDGLRGFANEAFLAGAHAVIAVPVLPTATAGLVLAQLTHAIGSWSSVPNDERLSQLADELRTIIYADLARDDDTDQDRLRRIELALDVCLFAPR